MQRHRHPDRHDHSFVFLFLLQVMEQEIVVKPGDNDIVRLSILPLKPGLLRITGLEWVLNGQAQGKRLFAAKAPQHRRTGSRSASASVHCVKP